MSKTLHDGSIRFEILARDDRILSFRDIPAALDFLGRFKKDPAVIRIVRSAMAGSSHDVRRLGTEEVLAEFAALLVSGQFKILRSSVLMQKVLHDGPIRFGILTRDDSILSFGDIPAALDFLRRFKNNPAMIMILRSAMAGSSYDLHRLDTEEVLKQFAALIVNGQFKILRLPQYLGGVGGGEEVEEQKAKKKEVKGTQPAPRKTSWIEIYLRDADGQPVPGEKYRIEMPDGSVEEGNLDGFGHAEYYGINPGTCQVSFPDLDADAWERA